MAARSSRVMVRIKGFVLLMLMAWAVMIASGSLEPAKLSKIYAAEADEQATTAKKMERPALKEARVRARLLHETIHGSLQVMHRDFFHEDEKLRIPSSSLEDVFAVLTRRYQVELRWLAVNTEAMNIDHHAKTEFEKNAVKALSADKQEFELREKDIYRYAGKIRLSSVCLKCHVPNRTSNKDRAAALVISMPIKQP